MLPLTCLVLAAGKGTRMHSDLPKVLHPLASRPLLGHVLETASTLSPEKTIVVSGPNMPEIISYLETLKNFKASPTVVFQNERKGTGHAVLEARQALLSCAPSTVLILYGDVPLLQAPTLQNLLAKVTPQTPLAILGFEAKNPHGYGRLCIDSQQKVFAIVEELDASLEEKKNKLCNSGVLAIKSDLLLELLPQITPNNVKGEYYLTDLISLATQSGNTCTYTLCAEEEVLGINTREQLAQAEYIFQERTRKYWMQKGVTLFAPETVFFSADTVLAQDITIEPNVVFGPQVCIDKSVLIRSFSYLEGVKIASHATIGPFARLRPGTVIDQSVHIGNFVEIKNSHLQEGAKVNHLAYIGDAEIGQKTNIGAGVITCNYDGVSKHQTLIGNACFVGTNCSLVAPLTIGEGAYIAAGSVVTSPVEPDSLYMTRGPQKVKTNWVKRYLSALKKRKKEHEN